MAMEDGPDKPVTREAECALAEAYILKNPNNAPWLDWLCYELAIGQSKMNRVMAANVDIAMQFGGEATYPAPPATRTV